jgi:putative toxin-antitoxin system antitoxin component (TIGR02293 family)
MNGQAIQIEKPELGEQALYNRIEDTLGVHVASDHDLAEIVESRLPTKVIGSLIRNGLTDSNVYELVIPRRTLSHRKSRRQKLTCEESDRVVRLARTMALAEQVFGDRAKALSWLRGPKRLFQGRAPLELLSSEAGARLVEEALYQIDDGIFG